MIQCIFIVCTDMDFWLSFNPIDCMNIAIFGVCRLWHKSSIASVIRETWTVVVGEIVSFYKPDTKASINCNGWCFMFYYVPINVILQRLMLAVIPDIRCSFEDRNDVACQGLTNVEDDSDSREKVEPWVKVTAAGNTPAQDHTMGTGKAFFTVGHFSILLHPFHFSSVSFFFVVCLSWKVNHWFIMSHLISSLINLPYSAQYLGTLMPPVRPRSNLTSIIPCRIKRNAVPAVCAALAVSFNVLFFILLTNTICHTIMGPIIYFSTVCSSTILLMNKTLQEPSFCKKYDGTQPLQSIVWGGCQSVDNTKSP